jgi:hypothetical protein
VSRYSLTHVPNLALLRELRALVAQDLAITALLLAHLAEVDARRLYAPAGYPSMFAWCVAELHLSEDAAFKRIRAARTARQFPAIYGLLADGRLHLTAVVFLTPYLTPENADELLAAAAHRSKAEIEQLLADRFPRPDLPVRIDVLTPPPAIGELVPEPVESRAPGARQLVPEPVESPSPGTADPSLADFFPSPVTVTSKVGPLAPGRYGLQFTVAQGTFEKLRYAQALLGHAVPVGELAEVFDRALDALIVRLEQRKFAATTRPRTRQRRVNASPRHVPAEVRRAVWQRDGGRCTYVSTGGHRCEARTRLEFDHVEPVARGGRATVERMRLRCRTHNQHAAECVFGTDFMSRKREVAQRASDAARSRAAATEEARALAAAAADDARALAAAAAEEARVRAAAEEEVVPWLRGLGLRVEEARRAAARCGAIPHAPLEERVRCALSSLARPGLFMSRVARMRDDRGMQGPVTGRDAAGVEHPVEERPATGPRQTAVRSRSQQRIMNSPG